MPFNLFLLPLLAGFIAISKTHLSRYATSQLQKEQLLLRASLVGLALLAISRSVCIVLDHLSSHRLAVALHDLAPFDYFGTAVGTIILAYLGVWLVNLLLPENLAGYRTYHSGEFNQLETILLQSAIGTPPNGLRIRAPRLILIQLNRTGLTTLRVWNRRRKRAHCRKRIRAVVARWGSRNRIFPIAEPRLLMLSLKDGKVYVGYVNALPPIKAAGLEYVKLLPLWSGYRDSITKRVFRTTSYFSALEAASDPLIFLKVFPCSEIAMASLFEPEAFQLTDEIDGTSQEAPKQTSIASHFGGGNGSSSDNN